jgi:uncharacterized protein YkwD
VKKALTLSLLAAVVVLLFLPATAPALTPTSTEKQVISLINKERTKRGLAKVRFKSSLTRAARSHSTEMAKRRRLTHYSANGWSFATRLRRKGYTSRGYRYWSVGENIARAKKGTLWATPTVIVAKWMGSSVHRKNILKRAFRDVGVGIRTSSDGKWYYTVDLGRRKG